MSLLWYLGFPPMLTLMLPFLTFHSHDKYMATYLNVATCKVLVSHVDHYEASRIRQKQWHQLLRRNVRGLQAALGLRIHVEKG